MIKRENFGIECADIDGEISETIRTAGENDKKKCCGECCEYRGEW